MMKKNTCLLCFILCVTLLAGCAPKSNMPGKVSWEMTAEQVTQTVGKDKVQQGSSESILNQMLTKDYADLYGDRTVSLAYVFSKEDKLSSITVQVFANESESIEEAMKNTRTVMEKTYGKGSVADSETHWHTKESAIGMQKIEGTADFFVVIYQPITAHSH